MNIEFDSNLHLYSVNSEIANISVTELLRKHKLAPDFKGVDKKVLHAAAEKGSTIHRDLECLIRFVGYDPMTEEGVAFKKYIESYIDCATAEQMVAYKYKSMWIVGTCDILGFFKNAEWGCFLGDHKTTSVVHREAVTWQVSILDYMFRKLREPINDKTIKWKGANQLLCFHYTKDSELEVIKLDKIPDEEIERLFECEYKGEIYERRELVVEEEIQENMNNLTIAIKSAEDRLKKLKAQQAKYKEIIKDSMEQQGIKSYENEYLKLTYVCKQEKNVVDVDKLKKLYPQVWAECQKIQTTSSSLRITIKGEEDEE